ncbi:MAG: cation:proton antiporter subunit C [Actinomycetota bacterium]|nr:cation:proton antiporter subunit C [Actinomycetota bacterium]
MIVQKLGANFNYVIATLLFCIGLFTVITKPNLIKKFMGLNIMEASVFLFIVSVGAVREGSAPIVVKGMEKGVQFVNPLPQALILTGIVVAVSTTALALALMIKLYEQCGTLDADELKGMEE